MTGKVLTIRTGNIVGNMLTGIDEIEPRHLPHHKKDVVDADTRHFLNGLRQAYCQLAFLLLRPSDSNVARDDRHEVLLALRMWATLVLLPLLSSDPVTAHPCGLLAPLPGHVPFTPALPAGVKEERHESSPARPGPCLTGNRNPRIP